MKLRIKETGELLEDVKFIDTTLHKITVQYLDDGVLRECSIKNLSDIEEVKDYEEPTTYYYISDFGAVRECEIGKFPEDEEDRKEIGNYFETEEEAERAVERLCAWKRLKDKAFKFIGKTYETDKRFGSIFYKVDDDTYSEDIIDDLDLLFGGEE